MSKTAVVYWSGTGNTEAMAAAVAEGIKENGGEASLFTAAEFDPKFMAEYDAAAFGCPAMGAEVLEEDEFEPLFEACEGSIKGKKIALFGSYGWGDGEWMRNWRTDAERTVRFLPATALSAMTRPMTTRLHPARLSAQHWCDFRKYRCIPITVPAQPSAARGLRYKRRLFRVCITEKRKIQKINYAVDK